MAAERFETVVGTEGAGTFVEVPLDVPAVFGRVRAPVRVTVNGHTWRSTVMGYGERCYLPLNRANREAAGVAAGDPVSVLVESDDAPRTVDVPEDLGAALEAEPGRGRRSTRPRSRTGGNGSSGWRRPGGPRRAPGGCGAWWSRCSRPVHDEAAFAGGSRGDACGAFALRSSAARGCA